MLRRHAREIEELQAAEATIEVLREQIESFVRKFKPTQDMRAAAALQPPNVAPPEPVAAAEPEPSPPAADAATVDAAGSLEAPAEAPAEAEIAAAEPADSTDQMTDSSDQTGPVNAETAAPDPAVVAAPPARRPSRDPDYNPDGDNRPKTNFDVFLRASHTGRF